MVEQPQRKNSDMSKTLHYPNGTPVPLRDIWESVDQLGQVLAESYKVKADAKTHGVADDVGLNTESEQEAISERNRLLAYLVENHGDKLKPQARFTVVTKEKNEKGRHYRKGEFRLFIGAFSSFILEIGVTPDNLDVDPKKLRRVLQITDDTPFRAAKTADERKALVKQFVSNIL